MAETLQLLSHILVRKCSDEGKSYVTNNNNHHHHHRGFPVRLLQPRP